MVYGPDRLFVPMHFRLVDLRKTCRVLARYEKDVIQNTVFGTSKTYNIIVVNLCIQARLHRLEN